MKPLSELVGSRQRKDIVHFETILKDIDEYWIAVERRYIILFCFLLGWNTWNIIYICNCIFDTKCGYGFLSMWNLSHTIIAASAISLFLKNKPLQTLNRARVHEERCQNGLSLLNMYRDEKKKKVFHVNN